MGVVLLVDAVELDAFVEWRKGDGQGGFRQAVARQEGLRRKAGDAEGLGEAPQRLRPHHLAADAGHAPARQVDGLGGAVEAARSAELVAERRAEGDRKSTRLNSSH